MRPGVALHECPNVMQALPRKCLGIARLKHALWSSTRRSALGTGASVVQVQALRSHSGLQHDSQGVSELRQAILWEASQGFVNSKGSIHFADFLPRALRAAQRSLPAQQAQLLAELDPTGYSQWDAYKRQQFCESVQSSLRQPVQPRGRPYMAPNSRPWPMGSPKRMVPSSSARATPRPNQTPHTGEAVQQQSVASALPHPSQNGAGLAKAVFQPPPSQQADAAPADTALQEASQMEVPVSGVSQRRDDNRSQPVGNGSERGHVQSQSQRAAAAQAELSPEVKAFLAKPVSGPYRPIIFDLETTGRMGPQERIVELAAIGQHSGNQYASIVNTWPVESGPGALGVHGISNAEAHHPSTPTMGVVAGKFLELIARECSRPEGGIPVIVAHNGKTFDYKFLKMEFTRWGLTIPGDWRYLDTLALARMAVRDVPGEKVLRSQDALRQRYGIAANNAHRALDDCIILLQVLPKLLQDNGTPDIADVMDLGTKAAGTFADLLGPAPHIKTAAATKQKSTEQTFESLVEEEEAYTSEPDPVSISLPALPQPSSVNTVELAKVKTQWQENVVRNDGVNRGLLDLPPDKVKGLTPAQRRDLTKAGFESFWEVLQHYPKDYIFHDTRLQHHSHVIVSGRILKAFPAGHLCLIDVEVDPQFNPPSCSTASGSQHSSSSINEALSGMSLTEHGRTVAPEEASTSTSTSTASAISASPSSASVPPASVSTPPQILRIKRFLGNPRAGWGLAAKYPNGARVTVQGKVTKSSKPGEWDCASDTEILPHQPLPIPHLLPRYSARTPIKDKAWPGIIQRALSIVQQDVGLQSYDVIPGSLSDQYDLIGWMQALDHMHKPGNEANLEIAKHRMAFEELFLLQLKLLLRREVDRTPRSETDAQGIRIQQLDMMQAGTDAMGFTLTSAQDRVLAEILQDLQGPVPMVRLMQGDVGSGKTAVAFLALLAAVGSGWQGAMMAPTEVLAEQHMMKLERLIGSMPEGLRPTAALLTGSAKARERRAVYAGLADGSIDLVMGTHALITDALDFQKLGLAVIDEQHRFGVQQRAKLQSKNQPLPHLLTMTATPIPRTLALTVHGDMALSAIDQLPPGRQPVQTFAFKDTATERKKMYSAIREELQAGGRVYFVYPLVEESSSEIMASVKAAEEEFRKLQGTKVLGDFSCGLLHGRMSSEEKIAALQAFATGATPVLLSTTVIEVGVDVPEATIMVVEHSERFGLAQLHQLRGRVGRGLRASSCYLVTPSANALPRLQVLTRSQNGFTIAEADLQERGPGDFLGKKQSGVNGLGYLKVAKLPRDRQILEQARAGAAELLQESGLEPASWSKDLLAALKDKSLPDLDLAELPTAWNQQPETK